MQSLRRHLPLALMLSAALAASAATGDGKTQTRLRFYHDHLDQYLKILRKADTLTPYYLAYRVNDTLYHSYQTNRGGVIEDKSGASRYFGVEARVGSGRFDNTHPMRENLDFTSWEGYQNVRVPFEPEGKPAEQALKTATDFAYRAAKDQFIKIKANVDVRPAENDSGLDFASALRPTREDDAEGWGIGAGDHRDDHVW